MLLRKFVFIFLLVSLVIFYVPSKVFAAEQPVAIFHAFNQRYNDVEKFVCALAEQGYSHVQISPTQKSNPNNVNSNPDAPVNKWAGRYQPVNYSVIDGLGSEQNLKALTDKAHGCGVKVIADVVFNHMANMSEYSSLTNFPDFPDPDAKDVESKGSAYFHKRCDINYNDGNTYTEINCWLAGLPDLNQDNSNVKRVQKAHLRKLLDLGIDGFRFDAAKHMPPNIVKEYIDYIDQESVGKAWNYLEVIEDGDTKANYYNWIAAVEDFILYGSMKNAFTFGGDLRSLKVPIAIDDSRSVVFGRNHDQIKRLNDDALNSYNDESDSYLATAYVLARQQGTPLVFGEDNLKVPYIPAGVKFRQIMRQRGMEGKNVKDNVLGVIDNSTVLMMERGAEGFFIENKGAGKFDIPILDLTQTDLEGCYRELRNNFTVAIENRNGKKYITQWGTWNRGGMEVQGRDALYFIREPFNQCTK